MSLRRPHSRSMLPYIVSLCHAGLGNISMHIMDLHHAGDITLFQDMHLIMPSASFCQAAVQPGKYVCFSATVSFLAPWLQQ